MKSIKKVKDIKGKACKREHPMFNQRVVYRLSIQTINVNISFCIPNIQSYTRIHMYTRVHMCAHIHVCQL